MTTATHITKDRALDALSEIQSRLEAYELRTHSDYISEEMDAALNVLEAYIQQSEKAIAEAEDLEWDDGVNPVCWDRVENDEDLREEVIREKGIKWLQEEPDEVVAEYLAEQGMGRHYGNPHCIYCLQGS